MLFDKKLIFSWHFFDKNLMLIEPRVDPISLGCNTAAFRGSKDKAILKHNLRGRLPESRKIPVAQTIAIKNYSTANWRIQLIWKVPVRVVRIRVSGHLPGDAQKVEIGIFRLTKLSGRGELNHFSCHFWIASDAINVFISREKRVRIFSSFLRNASAFGRRE